MNISVLRPVPRRLLGVGTALALAFAGPLATPASAHPQTPSPGHDTVSHTVSYTVSYAVSYAEADGGQGGIPWLTIVIGLLVGIGIGLAMVFRAKRGAEREQKTREHKTENKAGARDNGSVGGGD